MDPFCEPFPKELRVGGKDYPIRTDFRAVLKIVSNLQEAEGPAEKLIHTLSLFKTMPENVEEAVKAVGDFIACREEGERPEEKKERKKTFSYKKDAPFIVSDFLRFYDIDLTSCKYLHWQKFQLLLEGLSGDSETKQRIAYRSINTGKIKDRHERERIQRIQRAIAIEDTEADAERIGDLFGRLM